jgi:uncharacterized protein (TIGR03066 family)
MKRCCVAASVLVALLLASSFSHGQTPKDKERILGKWEETKKEGEAETKRSLDFQKDGKVTLSASLKLGNDKPTALSVEGSYKWVDKDRIEVVFKAPEVDLEEKMTLTVKKLDDKELILSAKTGRGEKEEEMKLTRVK